MKYLFSFVLAILILLGSGIAHLVVAIYLVVMLIYIGCFRACYNVFNHIRSVYRLYYKKSKIIVLIAIISLSSCSHRYSLMEINDMKMQYHFEELDYWVSKKNQIVFTDGDSIYRFKVKKGVKVN